MRNNIGYARLFFAIAFAGLALFMLVYGDFAPAGQTLPASIPARETLVRGCALLVLAASAGLCFARTALVSIGTIGVYLAVWAVICIPQVLSGPLTIGGWYGFCEALSALVGAWLVYSTVRSTSGERAQRVALILFGLTCVFYGWSHFVYADYTATMVPAWLPGRLALAYFTGFGHAAAGIGIAIGILPRLAATLEAIMMSLFSLLVWMPSFFAQPRPEWATPPQNQWSEFVVTVLLTASAWVVATSLQKRPWGFAAGDSAR
jgi:uncharacterized membrane protein YphA (DoxX/SURF4 family)